MGYLDSDVRLVDSIKKRLKKERGLINKRLGSTPRSLGTNPRAKGTNPRAKKKKLEYDKKLAIEWNERMDFMRSI